MIRVENCTSDRAIENTSMRIFEEFYPDGGGQ